MASTGDTWRLGHRPALDGLRGVAVLLVISYHALRLWTRAPGTVGVTAFFTLSGFLITALLLEEKDKWGYVDLARFMARRARRLLPALVAFLAIWMAPLLALGFAPRSGVLATLVYGTNWVAASGTRLLGIEHLWSLAVEEQFYLVWPLVVVACCRRSERLVAVVAGAGIVVSIALRYALYDSGAGQNRVYFGTDTRMDALLVGCLAAVAVRAGLRTRSRLLPALALLTLLLVASSTSRNLFAPTVTPWLVAAILVGAASGTAPAALSARWLRWVGLRSYGLYLWHFPLVFLANQIGGAYWAVLAALLSVAMAELSWRLVERRWLRGERLHHRHAGKPADVGVHRAALSVH